MPASKLKALPLLGLLTLAACQGGTPPTVTPTALPTTVDASPSPTPTETPTATPTPAAGFRDDFDGTTLDETRWLSFPQTGIVRLADGKLDLLNTANQKNFPYLVTRNDVIPADGPFFMECSFGVASTGTFVGFYLDYLPADQPNEAPLTSPFMSTGSFYSGLQLNFDTESGRQTFTGLSGTKQGEQHRVRVENDGHQSYRVIFDSTELGRFTSKRRPRKFWIGQNPPKDTTGTNWARIQFDYVAVGALDAPDPAQPAPGASPTP